MDKEDVLESVGQAVEFYSQRRGHCFNDEDVEVQYFDEYVVLEIGGKRFKVTVEVDE